MLPVTLSRPAYAFRKTKLGAWLISPTAHGRWILKLKGNANGFVVVDTFESPEAAAHAAAVSETSEFAPESHWRKREDFELQQWSIVAPAGERSGEAPGLIAVKLGRVIHALRTRWAKTTNRRGRLTPADFASAR